MNSSKPFMELLSQKPIALLMKGNSLQKKSEFGLENLPEPILDFKFQWNVSLVPLFKEEFESNKISFSGAYEVSQLHSYFQKRAEEDMDKKTKGNPTQGGRKKHRFFCRPRSIRLFGTIPRLNGNFRKKPSRMFVFLY